MEILKQLNGIDLYLLDQLQKGRITKETKILDAGCGVGRNARFFIEQGYNITGFDPMEEHIAEIHQAYPEHKDKFTVDTIETFSSKYKFNFVICNAVLHFAENHKHFQLMMASLAALLREDGILFIRMTSDFARRKFFGFSVDGRIDLPDDTNRYLLSKEQLTIALEACDLYYVEPLKTVNVNNERCMSTLILSKSQNPAK